MKFLYLLYTLYILGLCLLPLCSGYSISFSKISQFSKVSNAPLSLDANDARGRDRDRDRDRDSRYHHRYQRNLHLGASPSPSTEVAIAESQKSDKNGTETNKEAELQVDLSQLKPFLKIAVPFFKEDKEARQSLYGKI